MLNEYFPNWADGGGIFSLLASYNQPEWLRDALALDVEYHTNHSGSKTESPVLSAMHKPLTIGEQETLCRLLLQKFTNKWNRLYKLLLLEYNPIENYDSEETESMPGYTDTLTPPETKTEADTDTSVYGFDSSEASDAGKTHTETDNTVTTDGKTVHTVDGVRHLRRHGNIGVTTSQQMMQSEIDLWQWSLYEEIMRDIDTILTLSVY